jgi:hypothetical protein
MKFSAAICHTGNRDRSGHLGQQMPPAIAQA